MKRIKILLVSSLLVTAFALTACGNQAEPVKTDDAAVSSAEVTTKPSQEAETTEEIESVQETSAEKPRLEDDLYEYVNFDWYQTAEIPADMPSTGGFTTLQKNVDEQLQKDLNDGLANGGTEKPGTHGEMYKYYSIASDLERFNTMGFEPVQPTIDVINGFTTLADYVAYDNYDGEKATSVPSFVAANMGVDMKDSNKYSIELGAPSLILPEKTYYNTESGDALLAVYSSSAKDLLTLAGYDDAQADQMIKDTLEIDAMFVETAFSAEEMSDYTKMYNPVSYDEFKEKYDSKPIPFLKKIEDKIGKKPEEVIVPNPAAIEALSTILTEENWGKIKNYLIVNTYASASEMLSDEARNAFAPYGLAMTGQAENTSREKDAYQYVNSRFSEVIGEFYVQNHFSPEAKADVEEMTKKMIEQYEKSLKENDWLSEETKKVAIEKLQTMNIKIGYPDKIQPYYEQIKVDPDASLYQNNLEIGRILQNYVWSLYGTPVDKTEWGCPAQMVNAFYNPSSNDITFPAAILQAPFYDINQTPSQNYGGIGAVIAHEISHAFDTNGSKYDKNGNLNDWWTEEDYAEFEKRTNAMVEQFNNETLNGKPVNGTLTISENVADAGGLNTALQVVETLPDKDIKAFFENWATVWQIKSSPEYTDLLLSVDVHAPNKLRANVQASNLDAFYTAFDIKETDGMWISPENRIVIW